MSSKRRGEEGQRHPEVLEQENWLGRGSSTLEKWVSTAVEEPLQRKESNQTKGERRKGEGGATNARNCKPRTTCEKVLEHARKGPYGGRMIPQRGGCREPRLRKEGG